MHNKQAHSVAKGLRSPEPRARSPGPASAGLSSPSIPAQILNPEDGGDDNSRPLLRAYREPDAGLVLPKLSHTQQCWKAGSNLTPTQERAEGGQTGCPASQGCTALRGRAKHRASWVMPTTKPHFFAWISIQPSCDFFFISLVTGGLFGWSAGGSPGRLVYNLVVILTWPWEEVSTPPSWLEDPKPNFLIIFSVFPPTPCTYQHACYRRQCRKYNPARSPDVPGKFEAIFTQMV